MLNEAMWFQAINDCGQLAEKYGIEHCMETSKQLIDSIKLKDFNESCLSDPCAKEILFKACACYGIRQMYAAFCWWNGNQLAADFQYRAYEFDASRAVKKLKEIVEGQDERDN
jgi:hypothetical protein